MRSAHFALLFSKLFLLIEGCIGWGRLRALIQALAEPEKWALIKSCKKVKKKKARAFYLGYSQSMPSSFCKYGKGFGGVFNIVLLSVYCGGKEREDEKLKNYMW